MKLQDARKIAQIITNVELKQMLDNAKAGIQDWKARADVNLGCTKGMAWNILGKDFDVEKQHHYLYKLNSVREFGDWLPAHLKPAKKAKRELPNPVHQDPQF